jgi:hypothetical protein
VKDFLKNLFNNQYVNIVMIWLTSIIIDTNTGNRYLTYILLTIAFLALLRALLKDLLGIETPYVKYLLKFLKFNRILEQVDDTEKFYHEMEKNYHQVKHLVNKKKGGIINLMKKLMKWLYANKVTLSGFLAAILILVELVFEISAKLNVSDEWYYTVIAILFILIEWAVFGRGAETIQKFMDIKEEKAKMKEIAKHEKALEKANKMRELLGLPPLEETKTEKPTVNASTIKPITKEELEEKYGKHI